MENTPFISILMASYNHAPYVGEQIESILGQTWKNWSLTISDDRSTDGSWEILKRYEAECPEKIKVVSGPGKFPNNHFSLLWNADPGADYYAWSDSDDVWLPGKLEAALEMMVPYGQSEPVLYGSDWWTLIDASGQEIGRHGSPLRFPPSFGHSLHESVTSGATMVFNNPARKVIALDPEGDMPPGQDGWAYTAVSGAGGHIVYDPRTFFRYRLHGTNVCNHMPGIRNDAANVAMGLRGHFKEVMEAKLSHLSRHAEILTPENRERLETMLRVHRGEGGPLHRLALMREAGFRRQSRLKSAFFLFMGMAGLL